MSGQILNGVKSSKSLSIGFNMASAGFDFDANQTDFIAEGDQVIGSILSGQTQLFGPEIGFRDTYRLVNSSAMDLYGTYGIHANIGFDDISDEKLILTQLGAAAGFTEEIHLDKNERSALLFSQGLKYNFNELSTQTTITDFKLTEREWAATVGAGAKLGDFRFMGTAETPINNNLLKFDPAQMNFSVEGVVDLSKNIDDLCRNRQADTTFEVFFGYQNKQLNAADAATDGRPVDATVGNAYAGLRVGF